MPAGVLDERNFGDAFVAPIGHGFLRSQTASSAASYADSLYKKPWPYYSCDITPGIRQENYF